MTTSFGEFKDRSGREWYFTTSQGRGVTYLCSGDDTQVTFSLDLANLRRAHELLKMALWFIEGDDDETSKGRPPTVPLGEVPGPKGPRPASGESDED
jgi:hypothetical protein